MKRVILIFVMAFISHNLFAQFVNIPDSNFRKYLAVHYAGAMVGNSMDTTHYQILNATNVQCDSLFIRDLDGIQYFDNLQILNCSHNMLNYLPKLPIGLTYLNCNVNQLDSLPTLPSTLVELHCASANLAHLPSIPQGTEIINCSYNKIDSLAPFTQQLVSFDCSNNLLDSLPILPNTIISLNCSSNSISFLPTLTNNLSYLNVVNNPIAVLPTLPNSLNELYCYNNSLTTLPSLPPNLSKLNCSNNALGSLPSLPSFLTELVCDNIQLNSMPTLPSTLILLSCNDNNLIVLPTLSNSLNILYCANNFIPSLPTLPASLLDLDYSKNPITSLPILPSSLNTLRWDNNSTTPLLPVLPSSLQYLYVNNTHLDSLQTNLPNLIRLRCSNDSLSFLPVLPSTLDELNCSSNHIVSLPQIPTGLTKLYTSSNLLTSLPFLPFTIRELNCSGNINLNCLPKLPNEMFVVDIFNTSISCLPNYFHINDFGYVTPSIVSMPLCAPPNACTCSWNIAGNIHVDTASNCINDSLYPGNRVRNLKVRMFNNSILQDQMMITSNGEYSFDTDDSENVDIYVDTSNTPFFVKCPVIGFKNVIITPTDSLKSNVNFGIDCNGIDAGVKSIFGRYRPATITHVNINAGDLAQFYNVQCSTITSAIVTTIIEGPASFVQASANSISPTSVSGNVLTYIVPNISGVDFNTAFNIDVITDVNATMGSEVCITTKITNIASDINLANNSLKICLPVVNSFDPNAKYVFPKSGSKPGDTLSYTIQFQNTGSDTAYQVIIKDTLSENLDANSIDLLGSSHPVEVKVKNQELTFYFYGINLLDSVHHEPESHGWVQFKIKLKDHLNWGTKTTNSASIYFDYNSPVLTNTCQNFIGQDTTYEVGTNPIALPNAFTPNGDGLNETFHILNKEFLIRKEIKIERILIKNRWGQTVFVDYGMDFKWEPLKTLAMDNYTYYIQYSTYSGNKYVQQGDVMIIK